VLKHEPPRPPVAPGRCGFKGGSWPRGGGLESGGRGCCKGTLGSPAQLKPAASYESLPRSKGMSIQAINEGVPMAQAYTCPMCNAIFPCISQLLAFKWKDYRAKGDARYKLMTLDADEFIRRFLIPCPARRISSHPSLRAPRQCQPGQQHCIGPPAHPSDANGMRVHYAQGPRRGRENYLTTRDDAQYCIKSVFNSIPKNSPPRHC
jgi:hypothetical protein